MSEHVRVEKGDGVMAITLARPERRNAITIAMYAALADALESAAKDPAVRVIALRGEGQDFAAGNDLADFLTALPRSDEEIPVWRLLRVLAENEVPLVAAVHGNCVGIGTTLLLHCDVVIAADDTRFSLPFVDLALVPEAASSLLLPRLAGRRHAARYLLLCEPFGAQEALHIGVASYVVAPERLEEKLHDVLARLLAKPAGALRAAQTLLRHGAREEVLDRMRLESQAFAERLQSDEAKQAINAFFESRGKRPA